MQDRLDPGAFLKDTVVTRDEWLAGRWWHYSADPLGWGATTGHEYVRVVALGVLRKQRYLGPFKLFRVEGSYN